MALHAYALQTFTRVPELRELIRGQEDAALKIQVSPVLAKLLLSRSQSRDNPQANRPIKGRHVTNLARDMAAGRWACNGETLILDQEGYILDGQHRLLAVLESGVTIESYVIVGMDRHVFRTVDHGARRTIGDTLAVSGHVDCNTLGGALRWVWLGERDLLGNTSHYKSATVGELYAELATHPTLPESVRMGNKCRAMFRSPALAAGMHYLFATVNRARADQLYMDLASGIGLPEGSPALTLRNRLLKDKGSRTKLDMIHIVAYVIKAWNALMEGKSLYVLKWSNQAEEKAEIFPRIWGYTPPKASEGS